MERFTKITDANGDHIITRDNNTGLEWYIRHLGLFSNERNNSVAEKACRELCIGDRIGWRLPTLPELLFLVDYSRCEPAIDEEFFPRICPYDFSDIWTSTPYKRFTYGSGYAWVVDLEDGKSERIARDRCKNVIAVRDPNAAAAKAGA